MATEACHNGAMAEPRRWFDAAPPQTLQTAVILCYVLGVLGVLFGYGNQGFLVSLALIPAGYGVANEKRWGYWLGVVLAGINVLVAALIVKLSGFNIEAIANLGFMVALLALFLHTQSREYQRVWFK